MNITIREGSIADVLTVNAEIPEFDAKGDKEKIAQRLSGRLVLILIAIVDDKVVGYKLGYQLSDAEFYSWLGAVHPKFRGQGIATSLLKRQESWALSKGFKAIRVKSMNRFPAMLQLLISQGYQICGYEDKSDCQQSKIRFVKHFT